MTRKRGKAVSTFLRKPFEEFFEESEAYLKAHPRNFTIKEAAVVETMFQRWCKSNGMDNMKAPAWAKVLYLSAFVTGVTYAGQELRGKFRQRPFHGEGG